MKDTRVARRITLRPGARGTIGELDGWPLSYDGRSFKVAGEVVDQTVVRAALVDAVDEAATRVFGSVWVKKLSTVAGLDLRRCERDRIARFGLPRATLEMLGKAAAHSQARALGDMMLAIARLQAIEPWSDRDVITQAKHTLRFAIKLVAVARKAENGQSPRP